MATDWGKVNERGERKHRALQNAILAVPGSARVLRRLTKAGANEHRVLSLLASAVGDTTFWIKPMRRQKKVLESLARQLDAVAKQAELVSLDPLTYGSLWMAMLGLGKWERVKPAKEHSPSMVFAAMRLYAQYCRDTAKAFGDFLRRYPPRHRRQMTDCLIQEVWMRTRRYHDREIAFLLTNAFEAVGQNREFTEDQIKKHRQRHVAPGINAYISRLSAISPTAPGKGTLRTP